MGKPRSVAPPLTDLGAGFYKTSFQGGLYAGGANTPPVAHQSVGAGLATNAVRNLDAAGYPDPAGKVVFASLGFSNVAQEFCGANTTSGCTTQSFMGRAAADPAVDHTNLVIVNGAQGSYDVSYWDSPMDPGYDVAQARLTALGVTEQQVQVVWLKAARARTLWSGALPNQSAEAYTLVPLLGNMIRAAKVRYPNLRIAFVSSRTYGGWANPSPLDGLYAEPYSHEMGFATKWVIQAQIDQMSAGGAVQNPSAGDLNYTTGVAPWVAWGPYLWADGANPRADGAVWLQSDVEPDMIHPSTYGQGKVGAALLRFLKLNTAAAPWFLA